MVLASRLWSMRHERPWFVAASVLALAVLFVYPAVEWVVRSLGVAQPWAYNDFGAYMGAVETWRAGDPLYVPNEEGGFWGQYLYPPVFLLLFWPLATLPFADAGLAWGVVSVALLWVGLQLVVARLGVSLRWWERLLGLWALAGFHPLLLSFKMGQTGGFLAAMLAFALAALLADDRPRASLAGALTAFVTTFKLAYAPVGAHLLADRGRFLGGVAAGVALVGLSVATFGVETNLAYLDVLVWGFEHGSGSDRLPKAYLWHPPYFRPLHWLPAATVVRGAVAVAVAVAATLARDADREVFALGVATFLLITPLPYVYYFVAALPALLASLAVEWERDGHPAVPVVVLLLLQVHAYGLRLLVGELPALVGDLPDPVYPLLQPGLWGVLLFFALASYRVGQAVVVPPVVQDHLHPSRRA